MLVVVVVAVIVSALVKAFLIRSFFIPSTSMQPTLEVDDRVMVNELVPDLVPVARGDVIVFTDPGGWLNTPKKQPPQGVDAAVSWFLDLIGVSASDSDDHLIKRVIGIPGDHVVCCTESGRLEINGVEIQEPYIKVPDGAASTMPFDVTVPADSYWVMGDNRTNSRDSRYNQDQPTKGFVPKPLVVGRAFALTWPVQRWSGLSNHPEVFEGVDERRALGGDPAVPGEREASSPLPWLAVARAGLMGGRAGFAVPVA